MASGSTTSYACCPWLDKGQVGTAVDTKCVEYLFHYFSDLLSLLFLSRPCQFFLWWGIITFTKSVGGWIII